LQQLELEAHEPSAPSRADPAADPAAPPVRRPPGRGVEVKPAPAHDQIGGVALTVPRGQGLHRGRGRKLDDPPHDEQTSPARTEGSDPPARWSRPRLGFRLRLGDVARQPVEVAFGHDLIMLLPFTGCTPTSSGSATPPARSAWTSTSTRS